PVELMPPALARWASGLSLGRLPDDLALAARQYLARQYQLEPSVSESMARRLATDVSRYVSHPAPPGTPPWAYLAAVVAERRRREMARVMAQRQQGPAGAGPGPAGAPRYGYGAPGGQSQPYPQPQPHGPPGGQPQPYGPPQTQT